jgi:HEPN domain-containing protein
MGHLSIEKALKGLIIQKNKEALPKTHNLLYLIEIIDLELPEDMYDFVFTLNRVSVLTRYPDNLQRMLNEYNIDTTEKMLGKGKELLKWLKSK